MVDSELQCIPDCGAIKAYPLGLNAIYCILLEEKN